MQRCRGNIGMHGPFKSRRAATGLVTGWLGFMFGAITERFGGSLQALMAILDPLEGFHGGFRLPYLGSHVLAYSTGIE